MFAEYQLGWRNSKLYRRRAGRRARNEASRPHPPRNLAAAERELGPPFRRELTAVLEKLEAVDRVLRQVLPVGYEFRRFPRKRFEMPNGMGLSYPTTNGLGRRHDKDPFIRGSNRLRNTRGAAWLEGAWERTVRAKTGSSSLRSQLGSEPLRQAPNMVIEPDNDQLLGPWSHVVFTEQTLLCFPSSEFGSQVGSEKKDDHGVGVPRGLPCSASEKMPAGRVYGGSGAKWWLRTRCGSISWIRTKRVPRIDCISSGGGKRGTRVASSPGKKCRSQSPRFPIRERRRTCRDQLVAKVGEAIHLRGPRTATPPGRCNRFPEGAHHVLAHLFDPEASSPSRYRISRSALTSVGRSSRHRIAPDVAHAGRPLAMASFSRRVLETRCRLQQVLTALFRQSVTKPISYAVCSSAADAPEAPSLAVFFSCVVGPELRANDAPARLSTTDLLEGNVAAARCRASLG